MADGVHILGIRHHGPGSARAVLRALDELKPDCVLIEGPPDANDAIAFAGSAGMKPPVAILVHDADEPANAVFYPFAEFSPEWQAIRWALARFVPVRFIDLPQSQRMPITAQRFQKLIEATAADVPNRDRDVPEVPQLPRAPIDPQLSRDPLQQLAEAAGFDDGERWWEYVVESRHGHGLDVFASIADAMAEVRMTAADRVSADEPLREAWMRRSIREAKKEGHCSVAVVCGAWHVPALNINSTTKKQDDELLRGLPKIKTAATWIPWTYDRLTYASGYGAGIHSPGWYEHLWSRGGSAIVESWMTRVARLLREKDIDCSSAHVIEAVRLSTTLATMRDRPLADLADISDATRAIFAFDSDVAMRLIGRELLVGIRMGEVPEDLPTVPLQQDLVKLQKRLRLKPEPQDKALDLDLRNDTDRQRSVLLHRLRLLGVDWGTPQGQGAGKGTFRESWALRWDPAFMIALVEAGALGSTIEAAAGAKLVQLAVDAGDLKSLTERLQDAMLADLGTAASALVSRIENVAAVTADVALLMKTLPALATLTRYGNVRETDESMVRHIIDGMIPRITIGLGGAVASLNDEAAATMEQHLGGTDQAIALIESLPHLEGWRAALAKIVEQPSVHGVIRGRSARLLLDGGQLGVEAVAQHLSQTLSRGTDPGQGARWLEGFLRGSGLLLIHDPNLLSLINDWIASINAEVFEELLPLLRRTFTTFPSGERRQIGSILKAPSGGSTPARAATAAGFNRERAARPLPLIIQILGVDA